MELTSIAAITTMIYLGIAIHGLNFGLWHLFRFKMCNSLKINHTIAFYGALAFYLTFWPLIMMGFFVIYRQNAIQELAHRYRYLCAHEAKRYDETLIAIFTKAEKLGLN